MPGTFDEGWKKVDLAWTRLIVREGKIQEAGEACAVE